MRRCCLLLSLVSAGCARAPETQVAEQTMVEIRVPRPAVSSDPAEPEHVPVPSSPDRADRSVPEPDDPESEADQPLPVPPAWMRSRAGPTGGPDCERLADCCLKAILVTSGADPAGCDQMRRFPATICAQILPELIREAAKHGISCRP